MKEFKNPQINIFKFSSRDAIITASSDYVGEGSEGGDLDFGGMSNAQPTQVNIDTITR